jgi:hypothetical protein
MRIATSTWALWLTSVVTLASVRAETLQIVTVDSAGQSLPCRVLVRGHDDNCVTPDGAVVLQTGANTSPALALPVNPKQKSPVWHAHS